MEPRKRPEPIKDFAVTDLGNGIFNITAPPMRYQQYLVLGEERALLIDTGFGVGSLKKIVDGLTGKPLILVNTHGHPDHGGGNAEFGAPLLHPADFDLYAEKCSLEARTAEAAHWNIPGIAEQLQPTPPAPLTLEDRHTFNLGGRMLTVIHTPGHTRGSVCILDVQTGTLFTGDNVQGRSTALVEPSAATVAEYLESMEKLAALPVKAICTGHMPAVLPSEYISLKIECAKRILGGETGEKLETPMGSGYVVEAGGTSIHYAPDKVR